jgi:hypothetical protein
LNDTGIKPTIQQNEQPKPKTIAAPLPPPSSSSLNDRAKSLLMHRRKLYLERAKAAKEANDRATAVDAFETVKLFNQALGQLIKFDIAYCAFNFLFRGHE